MNPTETMAQRLNYGDRPTRPGLYLGLFHGRKSPLKKMDSWGDSGPLLGPLEYCHTTYMAYIQLSFESPEDSVLCCNSTNTEVCLRTCEDTVHFEGTYYGDWTLFYVPPEGCHRPDDTFRYMPRDNRYRWHSTDDDE